MVKAVNYGGSGSPGNNPIKALDSEERNTSVESGKGGKRGELDRIIKQRHRG